MVDDCCPECPNYPECSWHPILGCGGDINCNGGGGDPCAPYTTTTKGPLVATNWGQRCTYNNLCPDKDCDDVCISNQNAWTGCVATAMAQILKYWSAPCTQEYIFATMPNNSGNGEVQRMMRDIGDAVDMDYGCSSSSADGDDTDNAFKDDFCYSLADRDSYVAGSYEVVIQDIKVNRPVLLDGCRTKNTAIPIVWYYYTNCHMWVCDGYERRQNSCYSTVKFYMNWGWNGSNNGWYGLYSWGPGTYNYQYARDFTHNIHP
ncbi:MAG: C10 family peptidase [Saprospiraceae bacterium]